MKYGTNYGANDARLEIKLPHGLKRTLRGLASSEDVSLGEYCRAVLELATLRNENVRAALAARKARMGLK